MGFDLASSLLTSPSLEVRTKGRRTYRMLQFYLGEYEKLVSNLMQTRWHMLANRLARTRLTTSGLYAVGHGRCKPWESYYFRLRHVEARGGFLWSSALHTSGGITSSDIFRVTLRFPLKHLTIFELPSCDNQPGRGTREMLYLRTNLVVITAAIREGEGLRELINMRDLDEYGIFRDLIEKTESARALSIGRQQNAAGTKTQNTSAPTYTGQSKETPVDGAGSSAQDETTAAVEEDADPQRDEDADIEFDLDMAIKYSQEKVGGVV